MKSLTIGIPKEHTQAARVYLRKNNLIVPGFPLIKKGNRIFLPVLPLNSTYKKALKKRFDAVILEQEIGEPAQHHDYKSLLASTLPLGNQLPSSYDLIGDIIIIDIPDDLMKYEGSIGAALLQTHTQVSTVLKKVGIRTGEFRTQQLQWLAGEKKTETIYKEHGVRLKLDVEKLYFSPRLSTERKRIYQQVQPNEDILVMFSGCGPYPLIIAKNTKAKCLTGIEKNPLAHYYAVENKRLNKILNVTFLQGDVKKIVPALKKSYDRILMPLPKGAEHYLILALSVAKAGTIVHFYDFQDEEGCKFSIKNVREACMDAGKSCTITGVVKCGKFSPGTYRICIDFVLS